jgi:hypothetical protein
MVPVYVVYVRSVSYSCSLAFCAVARGGLMNGMPVMAWEFRGIREPSLTGVTVPWALRMRGEIGRAHPVNLLASLEHLALGHGVHGILLG